MSDKPRRAGRRGLPCRRSRPVYGFSTVSGFPGRRLRGIGTGFIPGGVRRMRTYRVYFLARGDEVVGSRSFNAADDRAAKAIAEELCRDHPGCTAVEIWDGGWPLYRHLRAAS